MSCSYDAAGRFVAVKEGGSDIERYVYDKGGNMVKKVVRGSRFVVRDGVETLVRDGEYKTTTFTFDDANQLVSSTTDGVTTRYEYDALRVRRRGAYDQGRRQDGRRRFAFCCCRGVGAESRLRDARGSRISS